MQAKIKTAKTVTVELDEDAGKVLERLLSAFLRLENLFDETDLEFSADKRRTLALHLRDELQVALYGKTLTDEP